MLQNDKYQKGRGAQINTDNRFESLVYSRENVEAVDEWEMQLSKTEFIKIYPKTIVNKVTSPDVGLAYSANPYQGCEHGCIYCYARNSFEYWGYSAGQDFEQKILIKESAPQLFRQFLMHKKWQGEPITLSGNTDCYQPAERKFKLTRQLLETALEFHQPIHIITKNSLVCRDIDILSKMAQQNLVCVFVSVTGVDENIRRELEPRTATYAQRLHTIRELSVHKIPVGIMVAPIIPGINDHQIPSVLQAVASAGASTASYTFVRLNGAVEGLFRDWIQKTQPLKAEKVLSLVASGHGGSLHDSRYGTRMSGEGPIAQMVKIQFQQWTKKLGLTQNIRLDSSQFCRPGEQLRLF